MRIDEHDLTDVVCRVRHPEEQLDRIIVGKQLVG
jgi:hypothetical protein